MLLCKVEVFIMIWIIMTHFCSLCAGHMITSLDLIKWFLVFVLILHPWAPYALMYYFARSSVIQGRLFMYFLASSWPIWETVAVTARDLIHVIYKWTKMPMITTLLQDISSKLLVRCRCIRKYKYIWTHTTLRISIWLWWTVYTISFPRVPSYWCPI